MDASAGDGGSALQASLETPAGLAFDPGGNLYIADSGANRVRKVSTSGIITTAAGNGVGLEGGDGGPAAQARLNGPAGVAVDSTSALFIADQSGAAFAALTRSPA
jgi:DNA-binding beta-propeller fold protein YncE